MFKYTSTLFDAMTYVSEVFLEQTLTRNTRKVKKSEQILADIGSIGSTSNLSGSLDISHQIRGLNFHQFISGYTTNGPKQLQKSHMKFPNIFIVSLLPVKNKMKTSTFQEKDLY